MSYRCKLCDAAVPPKVPRRTHVISRTVRDRVTGLPRQEIAAEVPVCGACAALLKAGIKPVRPGVDSPVIMPATNGGPPKPRITAAPAKPRPVI